MSLCWQYNLCAEGRKRRGIVMDFITVIRPFVNIFYFLGLSLFPLNHYLCAYQVKVSICRRFVLLLPTIISCALKLCMCAACFIMINIYGQKFGYTSGIMTNSFLLCEMLTTLSVVTQNVVYSDTAIAILRNFRATEFLFENMLKQPISYTIFGRTYFKKMSVAFGAYVMLLGFFVVHYMSLDHVDVPLVLIKIMHFMSISMHVNVVFYIDLIAYNLKHLNKIIITKSGSQNTADKTNVFVVEKFRSAEMIRRRLSKFKIIHFHLWKITEQTNEFFGWMLIAILLQSFADFVYTAIWQLKVLYEEWNFINIIRKILEVG